MTKYHPLIKVSLIEEYQDNFLIPIYRFSSLIFNKLFSTQFNLPYLSLTLNPFLLLKIKE
jgi:hypothetical protein